MSYRRLAFSNARSTTAIPQRVAPDLSPLNADDPAMAAMTDFTRECPVAVSPDRHIDDALQDMIRAGVRALLVLDEGRVLGLITSYDIQGERPIQFLQSPACVHDTCLHRDVRVADIMTALEQLPVLDLRSVQPARVGDLLETFKATEQTHLVVVESHADGTSFVRGLISRTRLERQLGMAQEAVSPHRVERGDVVQTDTA